MRKRIFAIVCVLALIVALSAGAESAWKCDNCGKRVPETIGDVCPYCGARKHVHTWREATYTEPRTCVECGATEGEPLTPTPTPKPTPSPTPTLEPAPVEPKIVPFGESCTFQTQVKADGNVRVKATDEAYETISLTMRLVSYMLPQDYADRYANQYRLRGTEASVGFELLLNDYTGDLTVIPQDAIKLTLESEAGDVELGYRLMDAEISGNYGVKIDTNTPKELYKRYQYTNAAENLEYLVVTTYNDGEEGRILFKLKSDIAPEPSPAVIYPILQKGSNGDEVVALQKRLTELGYLEGAIDGAFGSGTERAVKAAQKALGFEQNGIADHQFQVKLFAGAEEETSDADQETASNAE